MFYSYNVSLSQHYANQRLIRRNFNNFATCLLRIGNATYNLLPDIMMDFYADKFLAKMNPKDMDDYHDDDAETMDPYYYGRD